MHDPYNEDVTHPWYEHVLMWLVGMGFGTWELLGRSRGVRHIVGGFLTSFLMTGFGLLVLVAQRDPSNVILKRIIFGDLALRAIPCGMVFVLLVALWKLRRTPPRYPTLWEMLGDHLLGMLAGLMIVWPLTMSAFQNNWRNNLEAVKGWAAMEQSLRETRGLCVNSITNRCRNSVELAEEFSQKDREDDLLVCIIE